MLSAVVLLLLSCIACASVAADAQSKDANDVDDVFRLLGYSASEDAFYFESFDKRKVRERAAALDPPPLNCAFARRCSCGFTNICPF